MTYWSKQIMLTEDQLRSAFSATNSSEPLAEGWSGLERFARKIEEVVKEEYGIEVPVEEPITCSDNYRLTLDILSERSWNRKRITYLIIFLSKIIQDNYLVFERYECFFDELRRLLMNELYVK